MEPHYLGPDGVPFSRAPGLKVIFGDGAAFGSNLTVESVVDCKKCDELVGVYKVAIGLYTTAQRGFQGPLVGDFELAWKELKRLREACKAADEGLLAHWREEHSDLAEKAGAS